MGPIRAQVSTKRLQARFAKLEKEARKRVMGAVFEGATMVQAEAVRLVQSPPKSGREYKRGSITHQASAPGEAPATDTGTLVRGIVVDMDKLGGEAYVISRAEYSLPLEYGTKDGKIQPRPFMAPAMRLKKGEVRALIKRELERAQDANS